MAVCQPCLCLPISNPPKKADLEKALKNFIIFRIPQTYPRPTKESLELATQLGPECARGYPEVRLPRQ